MASSLLDEFRHRYTALADSTLHSIHVSFGDTVVLERLGDRLDDFLALVETNINLFPGDEADTMRHNLVLLQTQVRHAYTQACQTAVTSYPALVSAPHTSRRGRPSFVFDEEWLRWAYSLRGPSWIARFLGIGRTTVRKALLRHGLALPHPPPACVSSSPTAPTSFTPPMAAWDNATLDNHLRDLCTSYPAAGLKLLIGMLDARGGRVSRDRVSQSLLRIDPVRRTFQRTAVQRRSYKVPGPNSLWHHDGWHGLIRWGIIIHAFIDGFSRLITALRAHDNNRAATVLALFLDGAHTYAVPQRLRGDHGGENVDVAEFIQAFNPARRNAYIWGRSVHNIRIERLWVDVAAQFGHKWNNFFCALEAYADLDPSNPAHIWLLHILFLDDINREATFWVQAWNRHKMTLPSAPAQSPVELYGFGVALTGIRGQSLHPGASVQPFPPHAPQDEGHFDGVTYGVDWDALRGPVLQASHAANNPSDSTDPPSISWAPSAARPATLSEVSVEPPVAPTPHPFQDYLHQSLRPYADTNDPALLAERWIQALARCRTQYPSLF